MYTHFEENKLYYNDNDIITVVYRFTFNFISF